MSSAAEGLWVLHPADLGGNEEGRDLKQGWVFCCIFFYSMNNHFLEGPETADPLIESRMIKNLLCTSTGLLQAHRVPKVWGSQISRQLAHEGCKIAALNTCRFYLPGDFPGIHFR